MKIINIADDIRVKDVSVVVVHTAPCLHLGSAAHSTAAAGENELPDVKRESAFLVFLNKRYCLPLSRACVIRYLSSSIPRGADVVAHSFYFVKQNFI